MLSRDTIIGAAIRIEDTVIEDTIPVQYLSLKNNKLSRYDEAEWTRLDDNYVLLNTIIIGRSQHLFDTFDVHVPEVGEYRLALLKVVPVELLGLFCRRLKNRLAQVPQADVQPPVLDLPYSRAVDLALEFGDRTIVGRVITERHVEGKWKTDKIWYLELPRGVENIDEARWIDEHDLLEQNLEHQIWQWGQNLFWRSATVIDSLRSRPRSFTGPRSSKTGKTTKPNKTWRMESVYLNIPLVLDNIDHSVDILPKSAALMKRGSDRRGEGLRI